MVLKFIILVLVVQDTHGSSCGLLQCIKTSCPFAAKTVAVGQTTCNCPPINTSHIPIWTNSTWRTLCRTGQSVSFINTESDKPQATWHILSVQEEDGGFSTLIATNLISITVNGLSPKSDYIFQLVLIDLNCCKFVNLEYISITTLSENIIPDPVKNILVHGWLPGKKMAVARIQWFPSDESGCYYNFLWQSEMQIFRKEVREVEELYNIEIGNMTYNSNHTLLVTAVVDEAESNHSTFILTAPSCLEINYYSLDICVPEKLEGLKVIETLVQEETSNISALYDVTVIWEVPQQLPVQVWVDIWTEVMGLNDSLHLVVAGNETSVVFSDVALGNSFKIRAWPISAAGPGAPAQLTFELDTSDPPVTDFMSIEEEIIMVIAITCCLIMFAIIVIYNKLSHKSSLADTNEMKVETVVSQKRSNVSLETESNSGDVSHYFNNQFEVPRDAVMLYGILGEGAFGIVRKGIVIRNGQRMNVAIKSAKEKPSKEDKEQLLQEIHVLQTLGSHMHVVSLVASVTTCPVEDMLVIVEYCANGDLQQYLQNAYLSAVTGDSNEKSHPHYENCIRPQLADAVVNQLYDALSDGNKFQLTTKDLVSFAWQVADGMEFLARNRIIHRDLAARNVLVTAERSLKISDFGLSRDIYQNNCYVKTGDGKVPIKWMAVESLLYQTYTTQSDVWSFGILMWEIMTFGSMPYSNASATNLIEFLTSGGRLPRPDNTSIKLYTTMLSCWNLKPYDRPRFTDLKELLCEIITCDDM